MADVNIILSTLRTCVYGTLELIDDPDVSQNMDEIMENIGFICRRFNRLDGMIENGEMPESWRA